MLCLREASERSTLVSAQTQGNLRKRRHAQEALVHEDGMAFGLIQFCVRVKH